MTTTSTRAPLPMQLRVVLGILLVGGVYGLYKLIRVSANADFGAMTIVKALPLIQLVLAVGLIKRMQAARIAAMLWFAFLTLVNVFVLMALMAGQEPAFTKASPGVASAVSLLSIATSLYGYYVLTRPTVTAAFATID